MLALTLAFALGAHLVLAATDHFGQVVFNGSPVPGAMVTATLGDKQVIVFTNQDGIYRLADLADGTWTIKIDMRGFSALSKEIAIAAGTQPSTWELTLLPYEEITRGLPPPRSQAPAPATSTSTASNGSTQGGNARPSGAAPASANAQGGFQRAGVTQQQRPPTAPAAAAARPVEEPPADANAANDGFLINGSVNNGAASPFAQLAAFGNNRRRPGALYNAQLAIIGNTSAWDARPYSITGDSTQVPAYNNLHFQGMFQGPLRIPKLLQRNAPQLFAAYQGSNDDNATTQSGRVPTPLERAGDFSQTLDRLGRPVQVIDPLTGLPFAGNTIPRDRISPQAAALLGYYPQPTGDSPDRNYQAPLIVATRTYGGQTRITQVVNQRNQVLGTAQYQRTTGTTRTLFAFEDENLSSATDVALMWNRRISQFLSIRTRYQYTQQTTSATPYFANRTNVSGEAGITGNDQSPENWGPPSLVFSSVTGLSDALPRFTRNRSNAGSFEGYFFRGRHNYTIGGDVKRNNIDIQSQQDPRGSFTFTGASTGHDFADFLLGTPAASSIAYGNADKYLRGWAFDAYINDDWRVGPALTVTAGARWEYESPFSELYGRLVNLDIAPNFTAVNPVLASDPRGTLTGTTYPSSLMHPDKFGIQPRIAIAWRPVAGSSLVVRAGYGIYRNSNVYQSITTMMAQQPPLSTAFSVPSTPDNPLTLARGFVPPTTTVPNTFAVDPDFNVSASHTWQVAVQRDLPASLTVNLTYLGTKGTNLIQEFLPNTYPAGTANPCLSCPSGYVFLTSDGSSRRHAGQFQVRRRLRNGLTASVQYTLAKADDDAASFQGANLSGTAFAQNWLDLDSEWGPSNFDQRHQVTAQFQYTTGVGLRGGTLVDGWRGTLFKGWTMTGQLTTGSGLPITPYYLATTPGTGFSGAVRASLTGLPTDAPAGYYLNPLAYARPASGTWGTVGRNSARGPSQFGLNAGITRTFPWGSRYNLDWRVDLTNVLNRVVYTSVHNVLGDPLFGLPDNVNQMRKITTTLRLRF